VLVQPSEEEDFGSSVAEAQACGIPVIIGPTSGNRDYLSARDIVLREGTAANLCDAMIAISQCGEGPDATAVSRLAAGKYFQPGRVADQILKILESPKCRTRKMGAGL
jgi:glycosyltransferase involved in cell wall biosynthesis